ncbi:hypothetical protein OL239_12945 [Arthrobacter sp. ATA002]|uniref:hypothetical protein n=1 Tax=Arthrobacter sp. ATA002 TaxID=2991715 RepID=UPI0022A762F5|nr:hypothetical protein [Arthrobacter sp. ATA002]WAP50881.1 hypothetical protein OL239_12945 [Arthrobacter sp. ATA002]
MSISTPPEIPGPGTGLRWRAITAEDVDGWLGLIRRIAAADKPGYVNQREDLEHVLEASSDDPARDTLLGLDRDGVPRAYGYLVRTEGSDKIHGAGEWTRSGAAAASALPCCAGSSSAPGSGCWKPAMRRASCGSWRRRTTSPMWRCSTPPTRQWCVTSPR